MRRALHRIDRRPHPARNLTTRLAACLTLTLALCACQTSLRVTAPTTPTAVIGVLAPLTGPMADVGAGILRSVQLAVDQANAGDKVKGWHIQVKAIDDMMNRSRGLAEAPALAATPNLIGVVGPLNSSVAEATAPVFASAGIALITPGATATDLTRGPNTDHPVRVASTLFRLAPNDNMQGAYAADTAVDGINSKNVVVLYDDTPHGSSIAAAFANQIRARGGIVSMVAQVDPRATDYTFLIANVLPHQPQLVFWGGYAPGAATFIRQARQNGLTVPLLGGDTLFDEDFGNTIGPDANGTFATSLGPPLYTSESGQPFRAAFVQAYGTNDWTPYGPPSYDAATLLIAVAAANLPGTTMVGSQTRSAILAAIQGAQLNGAIGPIAFDEFGDIRDPSLTMNQFSSNVWAPIGTRQL